MNTFTICRHAASGCNFPEGERPVPALALVDYRLRSGLTITRGAIADDLRWGHATPPSGGDIVAYRLHENK